MTKKYTSAIKFENEAQKDLIIKILESEKEEKPSYIVDTDDKECNIVVFTMENEKLFDAILDKMESEKLVVVNSIEMDDDESEGESCENETVDSSEEIDDEYPDTEDSDGGEEEIDDEYPDTEDSDGGEEEIESEDEDSDEVIED